MRTDFDFAPLYRATVGFDRVFDMLDSMSGQPNHGGYPPYNIEKTADDAWRIVMAVAGFTDAEINITQKENELLVAGKGNADRHDGTEFLYRGIVLPDGSPDDGPDAPTVPIRKLSSMRSVPDVVWLPSQKIGPQSLMPIRIWTESTPPAAS